jgi:hypothetical protein
MPGIPVSLLGVMARRVPLRLHEAGHARALPLLGCPTVLLSSVYPYVCASRGHHARVTRRRAFNNSSICEKELIKVGQWGNALNLGALKRPALMLISGAAGQAPEKRKPIECVRRYWQGVGVVLPTYSSVALKQACCHENRPVKSTHLR